MAYFCVQLFPDEPPKVRRGGSLSRAMNDLTYYDGGRAWIYEENVFGDLRFHSCAELAPGRIRNLWDSYDNPPKWSQDRNARALAENKRLEYV